MQSSFVQGGRRVAARPGRSHDLRSFASPPRDGFAPAPGLPMWVTHRLLGRILDTRVQGWTGVAARHFDPASPYANMCSPMVVCILFSRFALVGALKGRRELMGEPVGLAPEAGRRQVIGEVSPAAEAFGVVQGMRVGEALARCPELRLVPPDPDGVRSLWRTVLDRLERIGAACESDREGEAFFEADGLRGIHGGGLDGVLQAARTAIGRGGRIGLGAGP